MQAVTRKLIKASLVAAALASPAVGFAAVYDWTVNIPLQGGGSLSGSGQLVADDVISQSFDYAHTQFTGYLVTSISGMFDGVEITGLLPVDYSLTPTESFGNDNLINLAPTYIDNDGLGFSLATAPAGLHSEINLYFDATTSQSYRVNSGTLTLAPGGTFTLTPVPLPPAWPLAALALAGLCLLERRWARAGSAG